MKKSFTKIGSVLVGMALWCVPLMAQQLEKSEQAVWRTDNTNPKQSTELRSYLDGAEADSAITYTATGLKVSKKVFRDYDRYRFYDEYSWENNAWVLMNGEDPYPLTSYILILYDNYLTIPMLGSLGRFWDFGDNILKPVYDVHNNLVSLTVIQSYDGETDLVFSFTYNENNKPLQIEVLYYYSGRRRIINYQYDANGNGILYEEIYNDKIQLKMTCKYDADDRPTILSSYVWHETLQLAVLDWYEVYYYSDSNPRNIETGNSDPVGDTNEGGFDITINFPADSIAGGSFIVTLPDGFMLDESNTQLTITFSDFDLVITKQADNSWLLELKPKSTRSATLLSAEAGETLAHIAYTVDGTLKPGTYDITVGNILFDTPGGDVIPEPVITLSALLNRWATGNETVAASPSSAWSQNGTIYIRTAHPQQFTVYSLTGAKLHESIAPTGTTTLTHLPKGIYIIAFADGKRQKVPVN